MTRGTGRVQTTELAEHGKWLPSPDIIERWKASAYHQLCLPLLQFTHARLQIPTSYSYIGYWYASTLQPSMFAEHELITEKATERAEYRLERSEVVSGSQKEEAKLSLG